MKADPRIKDGMFINPGIQFQVVQVCVCLCECECINVFMSITFIMFP